MFGWGQRAHTLITQADEEEKQKNVRDVTGRDTLALMHGDVVKMSKGW